MECGVRGPVGLLVVEHVDTVPGRGCDSAIIPNQPLMAHTASGLEIRQRNAMPHILVQVRYFLFLSQLVGLSGIWSIGNKMKHCWCPVINDISKKSIRKQLIGHWVSKWNTAIIFLFPYAVRGMWGSWTSWTACSKSCGHGSRERKRFCDNPRPAFNGTYCIGVGNQKEPCNASHPCPSTSVCIPSQLVVLSGIRLASQWK